MSTISAGTTSTTALVSTGDTTGNLVLATGATPTTALTLNSTTQAATFAGAVTAPSVTSSGTVNALNTFGFENRIINGGMTIDQRNGGAAVTPASGAVTYTLDRWNFFVTQASKLTVQQSSTTATGFTKSMLVTSSSAYSVTASDRFQTTQPIEGFNVADLNFGTANAKTVTLSFWVRSSLTGTFGGALKNNAGNRSYPFTYTISAANTFEQKSITIAGDTTGTWSTDTNAGLLVVFGLGTGSTFSGTAGAWAAANYDSATGATSVVGTNAATWYVTGVQFEVGSQATSFDFRDYGRELILCQRYYQTYNPPPLRGIVVGSTAWGRAAMVLPVVMRTAPTVAIPTALPFFDGAAVGTSSNITTNFSTATTLELDLTATTGTLTATRPLICYQGVGGVLTASSEL